MWGRHSACGGRSDRAEGWPVNFLDLIWLIPLFPLAGALLMLLFGRLLDPQPESAVAVAPGVEHVHDEHDHHHHGHTHEHGHDHHHHSPFKWLVSVICPGMVLISFILSVGAVWQLTDKPGRVHQLIQFTWLAGLPFHMMDGRIATFSADWGFLLDPLSSVMILVVTGIGFLIHVYSTGGVDMDQKTNSGYYQDHDRAKWIEQESPIGAECGNAAIHHVERSPASHVNWMS